MILLKFYNDFLKQTKSMMVNSLEQFFQMPQKGAPVSVDITLFE